MRARCRPSTGHLGPVSLADVAPTVAATLGVTLPDVDGRPLPWVRPGAGAAAAPAGQRAVAALDEARSVAGR